MTIDFTLDPALARDSIILGAMPLSLVLLKRNSVFPWLILVPQRPNLVELIDINDQDAANFTKEVRWAARSMQQYLTTTERGKPSKLNIAALGNQVRQLHIHIIARYQNDSAWPNAVWALPNLQVPFAAKDHSVHSKETQAESAIENKWQTGILDYFSAQNADNHGIKFSVNKAPN